MFIAPNVTFTNDIYPKSNRTEHKSHIIFSTTRVCDGASIGGGATILPGIIIGKNSMIGAGAVISKNVEEKEKVYGERAKNKGWMHEK